MIKKTSFCVAILNDVVFLNFPFNHWCSALQPYPGKCITWSHQLFQSGSGIYIAVVLTLRKNNSITRESVPFSLEVVEEALVFICTWIFCVCRLHNINCHNYGHNVLQDCSLQNTEKSKLSVYMLFNCNSSLLNGHVKHCQGKYVIWHTCPADNWKKWIWNPGL